TLILFIFFYSSRDLLHLHSFPTRRSSDLTSAGLDAFWQTLQPSRSGTLYPGKNAATLCGTSADRSTGNSTPSRHRGDARTFAQRSEEHTSELQSRFDLVCRLLLEKKNK